MTRLISALEARRYRARTLLRRVLADDPRDEALALGLPLEGEELTGAWRETSLY